MSEQIDYEERLLNIREASKLLNLGRQTLYNWASQRKIEFVKLGGRLLFRPAAIRKLIDANTVTARSSARKGSS